MVDVRDFESTEITEIYNILEKHVPVSVLAQQFTLTEDAAKKAQVFTAIYRMLNSCKNAMSKEETKNKIDNLLTESLAVYLKIYIKLSIYESTGVAYTKFRSLKNLQLIFQDFNNMEKINRIIDVFMVFGGRIELYDINKISGINLETESGKKLKQEIVASIAGNKTEKSDNIEVDDSILPEELQNPDESMDNLENEYGGENENKENQETKESKPEETSQETEEQIV